MSVTAKSVILDIADNRGDVYSIGIRSIDFYKNSVKIVNINGTDFAAYSTTERNVDLAGWHAFDTSLSKIGPASSMAFQSGNFVTTNTRLICVFNSMTDFDEIVVNNWHESGSQTTRGAKNVKIHFSTDEITSTVYDESIPNSTLIYDDVFAEHIASNIEDEETLTLINVLITTFEGTVKVDGSFESREINFYLEPDLSTSIGSVTSTAVTGVWTIDLTVGGVDKITAICEGAGDEQSQVFNNIAAS